MQFVGQIIDLVAFLSVFYGVIFVLRLVVLSLSFGWRSVLFLTTASHLSFENVFRCYAHHLLEL